MRSEPSRIEILAEIRRLFDAHGFEALTTPFLEKKRLYRLIWAAGLTQADYLAHLGVAAEYAQWKIKNRTYRGRSGRGWTWERVLDEVHAVLEAHGELPSMDWFRKNGMTSLVNCVFRSEHTWEDVRAALGNFEKSTFRQSRNGLRWLSQPEASVSDFLYARDILHKRGEPYDKDYSIATGRRGGRYDVHFRARDGRWVDVEIWGDLPDHLCGGKYRKTRALKEAWNARNNPNFLGIQYQDCLSDEKLTKIFAPYIGIVEAFNHDVPADKLIETSHWTDGADLLEACRKLAATRPDGIFPGESWLRKRGKYASREGESYNSLALRVQQRLGGVRNVRKLLGQDHASTTSWTPESAVAAWREFTDAHGVAPTAMVVVGQKYPDELVRRANAIRAAVTRLGVLKEARGPAAGRSPTWTKDRVKVAWASFVANTGFAPFEAVGRTKKTRFSREVQLEAARLYKAAYKLGVLGELRSDAVTSIE
jgi:hypothetical protein